MMKKKIQSVIKGILSISLVFCMMIVYSVPSLATELPTDVTTPSTGNILVTKKVTFTTAEKDTILAELNRIRKEACDEHVWVPDPYQNEPNTNGTKLTSADYVPLKWSKELEAIAQTRAAETSVIWGHVRPNGDYWNQLVSNGKNSTLENIAMNMDANPTMAAISQWYAEKADYIANTGDPNTTVGHYATIIQPTYTYVGLATANSSGKKYTPLEISATAGSSEAQTKTDGEYDQVIEIKASSLEYTLTGKTALKTGDNEAYSLGATAFYTDSKNNIHNTGEVNIKSPITWTSSDTSVATVNATTGEVTAKKAGTAIITATANNVALKDTTITVTDKAVTSVANPSKITTESGTKPTLPTTLTATYDDGSTDSVSVVWDAIPEAQYKGRDANTFTVNGTAAGKTVTATIDVKVATISSVKNATDQTVYVKHAPTLPTQLEATWSNGDKTSETVKWDDVSATSYATPGTFTVNGTVSGYTPKVTAKVTVKDITAVSIALKTAPTKNKYVVGETTVDATGGVITVTYDDGSTKDMPVTDAMVSGLNTSAVTTNQSLTITFNGKTCTYNVDVVAKIADSIAMKNNPTKTTYIEGQELDLTGGSIEVTYNDASKGTINLSDAGVTVTGYDKTKTGQQTLTVTYEGKTTTFKVNVIAKTVDSIAVTTQPTKTTYFVGEEFDSTAGKITASYNDGTTEVVDLANATITGYDKTKAGTQTLTVTYKGKTTTLNVTVKAVTLDSIAVSTSPTKTSYIEGQDLDLTGGKITATYNNSTTKEINLADATVTGYDKTKTGAQTLTVTYEGKTTTFNVNVASKQVTSIAMNSNPNKVEYVVDSTFDVTGAKIDVNYDNGTKEVVNVTNDMISSVDTSTLGSKTVTVTYQGKTTTFNVNVVDKTLTSISVSTKPTKTTYKEGTTALDVTGGELKLTYDNGTTQTISMTAAMCNADLNKVGSQNVTVTYNGKTTSYPITVEAKALTSIAWSQNPTTTTCKEGTDYKFSGKVELTYDNGTKEIVDVTSTNFETVGFDKNTVGSQNIQLKYKGTDLTLDTTVEVIAKVATGISIQNNPKTEYVLGDKFDSSNLVAVINYDNGTSEVIPLVDLEISQPDMDSLGNKTITIKYGNYETSYTINVSKTLPPVINNNNNNINQTNNTVTTSPKTGDDVIIYTNVLILIFSGALMGLCFRKKESIKD
ncbi:MAG: bacterial Ig-like domain-containing protein [Thomasclavelia sp.]|nr:bacterial Ig-like domain-containing protein [Thomasclavelia sp.]